MSDFLAFRRMITPVIIQVVFWVGAALCVVAGLIGIVRGVTESYGGTWDFLTGLALLLLGPLVTRISAPSRTMCRSPI